MLLIELIDGTLILGVIGSAYVLYRFFTTRAKRNQEHTEIKRFWEDHKGLGATNKKR